MGRNSELICACGSMNWQVTERQGIRMNVATALNKKYIRYVIVMLTSLCMNNEKHIDAFILHSELTEDDIIFMEKSLAGYDISIIPIKVDNGIFDERFPKNSMWTVEMYYRLLLMELLTENVDRILYLDADTIVNKNIYEFYNVDFGDDEIIACIDSLGKPGWNDMSDMQRQMFSPMIEQGYRYFCSGVMLMNIVAIREKYNFDSYMDAAMTWDYKMSAPDQDILNFVHWEKIGYVDPYEYNLFARIAHNEKMTYEQVKEGTYIIHFAGEKPWNSKNVHFDIEKLWWDYAKATPFYFELLEEFLLDTLFETRVEDYICEILDNKKKMEEALEKSMEINRKLLGMVNPMVERRGV